MKQILDNFAALGAKRLAILASTGLIIVGALIFGLSVVLAPAWRPVAGDLSAAEGAAMVSALEQAGFAPRVSQDGSLVSLPEGEIARARMALAEAGLAAEGMPGWELFDNQSGLGMNTFLQRVNRLRAMEGELARSIQTMDVVEAARVHLVMPEREAFSSERPEASAAIIIRTRRGIILERAQAMAIRSLVAGALPGLQPNKVTVLSASGETILAADGETADASGSIHTARIAIEDRIARNVEQILGARVGAGNVRVRVAAELASEREVILRETFDPEGQVARETRSTTDSSSNSQGGSSSVDVLNNVPGGMDSSSDGGRDEQRQRTEDENRFEIGSTRSERVIEPGGLRRLSVAVLINGTMEDGTYSDRSPEELERLQGLVRSTMGFDEDRGDLLTVESLRFVEGGGLPNFDETPNTLAENLLGYLPSIMRWLIALVMVALIVFFVVRPALARMNGKDGADETPADAEKPPADLPPEEAEALAAAQVTQETSAAAAKTAEEDEYVSLASVRGAVTKRHLDELGELVEENNAAALRQIRVWLNQKS